MAIIETTVAINRIDDAIDRWVLDDHKDSRLKDFLTDVYSDLYGLKDERGHIHHGAFYKLIIATCYYIPLQEQSPRKN